MKRRHDQLKLVLADLARSCGYHVEVEPLFPARVQYQPDPVTGVVTRSVTKELKHGDLLLIRNNTRELIDLTVVRPTTLTQLRGSATGGAHMQPLVAATRAEKAKHQMYDAECVRHGWKLVPFALESLGARGKEASQLLQRLSAHSRDKSPAAFLAHADRVLSVALQSGNAGVAAQGTAELRLLAYRRGCPDGPPSSLSSRGPGWNHLRRAAADLSQGTGGLSAIMHSAYHSARCGVSHTAALRGAAAVGTAA